MKLTPKKNFYFTNTEFAAAQLVPFVSEVTTPFFQTFATSFVPLFSYPATYTSDPETYTERTSALFVPSVKDVPTPFFQIFATNFVPTFSDPATYTSVPETKTE